MITRIIRHVWRRPHQRLLAIRKKKYPLHLTFEAGYGKKVDRYTSTFGLRLSGPGSLWFPGRKVEIPVSTSGCLPAASRTQKSVSTGCLDGTVFGSSPAKCLSFQCFAVATFCLPRSCSCFLLCTLLPCTCSHFFFLLPIYYLHLQFSLLFCITNVVYIILYIVSCLLGFCFLVISQNVVTGFLVHLFHIILCLLVFE